MKILLKFRKSDFKDNSYIDATDCPITRALQRTVLKGWKDEGVGLVGRSTTYIICEKDIKNYRKMANLVISMIFLQILPIKPFQITIQIPDNEITN